MNLNGDEERIRQLFREVSSDDRHQAPQFAVVLASAKSGMSPSRNRHRSLRLAAAVAICALLLIAMAIIVSPPKSQRGSIPEDQAAAPNLRPEAAPSVGPSGRNVESPSPAPRRVVTKRPRSRPPVNRLEVAMKSLFAWRSPTASLLQTPGDELLRSLPRLGESLKAIKNYTLEQFN
jgi:hypothetical protein